jgi:hypothetical protein
MHLSRLGLVISLLLSSLQLCGMTALNYCQKGTPWVSEQLARTAKETASTLHHAGVTDTNVQGACGSAGLGAGLRYAKIRKEQLHEEAQTLAKNLDLNRANLKNMHEQACRLQIKYLCYRPWSPSFMGICLGLSCGKLLTDWFKESLKEA